jgi:PAS domain-containing protein
MSQKELEVILTRQFADCLAMPIFLVDEAGNLLFYNEPAEKILGRRFDETGELPAQEWSTLFTPRDEQGKLIPPAKLPLMIALSEHRPSHRLLQIRGLDGVPHRIEVTAFPLIGQRDRHLGAVAIFWEVEG